MSVSRELLAEGKTKKIWSDPSYSNRVYIESKEDVTSGDGARREQFEGKGAYSTETTSNCFTLLRKCGIPNHFLRRIDEKTFLAKKLQMIPIEVVVRGVSAGSYLKRNPEVKEGTIFSIPVVEFFFKDDVAHDPLIIYDFVSERVLFYNPKLPLGQGFIKELPMDNPRMTLISTTHVLALARDTFSVLRAEWAKQNVILVDLKIECGTDTATGEIMVGDVITNDEWRIWPGGIKANQLDKQMFREMAEITTDSMNLLKNNYAKVAQMTSLFL